MRRPLPSQDVLQELLSYDAETGHLFWRERNRRWFPNDRSHKVWNSRFAGKRAFTAAFTGYPCGQLLSCFHFAHRVIWKLVHGEEPDTIDHINGDRSDNRLSNIRSVSHRQNMQNVPRKSNNTTGVVGVSIRGDTGRYTARIRVGERYLSLGCFDTLEEAAAARRAASEKYGFHPNHGRERAA